MKKLSLAAIIVTVSISLIGCTNSGVANNGNGNNTESSIQDSSESSKQNNNVNNTGDISLDKAKEIFYGLRSEVPNSMYNNSKVSEILKEK